MIRWQAFGGSDVGRVRRGNEDAFLVDPERGIFLVADGMGGHAAGEVASAIAREVVGSALAREVDAGIDGVELERVLDASIRAAHEAITAHAAQHPGSRGMGTTLTCCVVTPDGTCRIGHVGDSRAYRMSGGVLEQLTRDHTWVQMEVEAGRISPAAARTHHLSHIITRALGADSTDDPDVRVGTLGPGDLLLLCTDGLTGKLDDGDLAHVLAMPIPLPERVGALIRAANARGGEDNITAVLVEILPG